MRIEPLSVGRNRAAVLAGIDRRRLGTWIDYRQLWRTEPTPRVFGYPEVLALALAARLVDRLQIAVPLALDAAQDRAAWRALRDGEDTLVLGLDDAARLVRVAAPHPGPLVVVGLAELAAETWPSTVRELLAIADPGAHDAIVEAEAAIPILAGARALVEGARS